MNIHENAENKQAYLDKYFTEDGLAALNNRVKFLMKEYIKEHKYPIVMKMLGFVPLTIASREQHKGMLEDLRQILGMQEIRMEVNYDDNKRVA